MVSPNTLKLRDHKPKTFAAMPGKKGDKWMPYELVRLADEPNREQRRKMGERNPNRKHRRWAMRHGQLGPAEDASPVSSVRTRREGKQNVNKRMLRKMHSAAVREARKDG